MTIQGTIRPDDSFVGFDYENQQWIDTDPHCERDPAARPGSARNPLAVFPCGYEGGQKPTVRQNLL